MYHCKTSIILFKPLETFKFFIGTRLVQLQILWADTYKSSGF